MTFSQPDQIPDDIVVPASGDIRDAIADFTHKLLDAWNEKHPFVVQFKTTQGTGKTTGVMDSLEVRGPVAALGPRHDDINEDADRFGDRFEIRFVGKDRACENDKYKGKHGSVGRDTSRSWCKDCPKRSECGYFEPYNQLENGVQSLTAPHNYLEFFPEILDQWPAVDTILIDETPWDAIFEKTLTIDASDIEHTRSALRTVRDRDSDTAELVGTAQTLLDDISDGLSDTDAEITPDAFEIATHTDFSGITDELSKIHDDRILEGNEYQDAILSITNKIGLVERTWEWARDADEDADTPPSELWGIDTSSRGKNKFLLRWRNAELQQIARDKPVFVLATEMPTQSVEAMFGLPVVTVEDEVTPEGEIIQLGTKHAGITRLRKRDRSYDTLLELTKLALRREYACGRKTLIAVKAALLEDVVEELEVSGLERGEAFEIGKYYGMTGSNRFEDCEAFIGFGAPGLSSETTEASAVISGLSPQIFKDEGLEGELRDAIHRIRPVRMDVAPRIYLFTNAVDFSSDFDGPRKEYNIPDLRSELKNNADIAERQQQIQDVIRAHPSDPTVAQIVDELPYGRRRIESELRDLNKQGITEPYKADTDGRGRPPKRYRLLAG